MNSWKYRFQKYNEDNNIVNLNNKKTIQTGGANYELPSLENDYFSTITLNNKSYPTNEKATIQIIKNIINYYNKLYQKNN